MLVLVGTHYHFRRVVPVALRPLFGKTEFWISLKTENKSDTSLLIMAFYNLVTRNDLFMLHADIIRK
ncbi:hypothetical protein FBY58_1864 [Zymomonas mobilis]|uniref:DUF6538 domain-containing protein n=1 Tax=Zymomonas mobilis TaxID=542 RepID=A0A542VUD3_ZYMMB|nr:hypothetical protein FBY58_1864 [Zymomonas mobilis]